jgi:dihydropteroate synthase
MSLEQRPALQTLRHQLYATRTKRRTLIMGILNVTPDSFSDGGEFNTVDSAIIHAEQMIAEGADILDIGGESTRPATFSTQSRLSVEEECTRILPVIQAISARFPQVPISVDTYKAEVAERAVEAGAVFINDITALRGDPAMLPLLVRSGVPVCLMHLLGMPKDIPLEPHYEDVVAEVKAHLLTQAEKALSAGVLAENILLDPGIGFGKTVAHNLALLRHLDALTQTPYLVLVGTSRKSTIGKVLGNLPPKERIEGTAATVALAIAKGAAIVRVHDVKEMVRVARMTEAVLYGWEEA